MVSRMMMPLIFVDRGNVFPARNYNVFRTVFDLHVSIWVNHCEVARMKPTAFECCFGRGLIVEIACTLVQINFDYVTAIKRQHM